MYKLSYLFIFAEIYSLMFGRLLVFFPLITLLAASCSSAGKEAGQTAISASCYIRYIAPERSLLAEATFYQGDSTDQQPLSFPAGVAFLGSGMDYDDIPGAGPRYQTRRKLPYPTDSLRFSFKEEHKADFTVIPMRMSPLDSLIITGAASLKEGFTIQLPEPLTGQESLMLLFSGPNNLSRTLVIEGPTRSNIANVPGPALKEFASGDYIISPIKKQDVRVQWGNLSYISAIEYYGFDAKLTLE